MSDSADYLVVDQPEQNRFVLTRDGEEVGYAAYTRSAGVIDFTHTQIDTERQEHGLGSRLAQGALDAVRAASEDRVVLDCPFMAHFVSEHPEYQDLLERTQSQEPEQRF